MRRGADAYLVAYFIVSLAIVVGFTATGEPPPRWLLVSFLPCLLLALSAVVWQVRQRSSVEEVPPDGSLELRD